MSNPLLRALSKVFCAVILTAVYLFQAGTATAQVANYNLTSTGDFVPLAGAAVQTLAGGSLDDGYYPLAPLGFTFRYNNADYTQVGANTNGWLKVGALANDISSNAYGNNLTGNPNRPLIAPLWDDLAVNSASGTVSYLTEGTAPNRVFTMQWLNMEWTYQGTAPAISFQVKLYETTNQIRFVYRQEAGALTAGGGQGASIGLAGTASGTFLSLNNSGSAPTASSAIETTSIFAKPASGQTYMFTPRSTASTVNQYNFTASGGFAPLAGANVQTVTGSLDDGYYPVAPLGFTFRYANIDYTEVSANTNGWMKFGSLANDNTTTSINNDLSGTPNRPLVAPLWDDIEVNSGSGSVSYLTEGTAPNRVFTMQWLNMEWSYLGTAPAISFQVKLYETSNRIQFIYRQEAGALANASGAGASIGLAGGVAGTFLSLSDSGASPTASSTVETENIFTRPANNQGYLFTPLAPSAAGLSISGRVLTASGAGLVNATVYLTDQTGAVQSARTTTFGNYHFENVRAGQTVVITVVSKKFQFSPQIVSVSENLTDLNFIAEESK